MQMLSTQLWMERLGWTLAHFLWQGLSIAVLYAAARRSMAKTSRPHARYLLACAALTAMMTAPLLTWRLIQPVHAIPGTTHHVRSSLSAASNIGVTASGLPATVRGAKSGVPASHFFSWVAIVWLANESVFLTWVAGGVVAAARVRSVMVRRAPPEWQEILGEFCAWVDLNRPVCLLDSELVQVPTVVGWLSPAVLGPLGALGRLPVEYLEALLLHELARIRRLDHLANLLQRIVEALLFYHPAVWWVSGHIRIERELCCDDVAASASGNSATYAQALLELESAKSLPSLEKSS